jgi:hypothetical protein
VTATKAARYVPFLVIMKCCSFRAWTDITVNPDARCRLAKTGTDTHRLTSLPDASNGKDALQVHGGERAVAEAVDIDLLTGGPAQRA